MSLTRKNKAMKLHSPFKIGPRLAPALCIQQYDSGCAWLSYDSGFVIDLPDGSEHKITDYRPGFSASRDLALQFGDILSFLGTCAESRSYRERKGLPVTDEDNGDNANLFPADVGAWAQSVSDELAMLQLEIEESETDLIEA